MKTPPISIQQITGLAEFSALEARWNSLLRSSGQETVFLSWQWLYTWWQVFAGNGMQLQILLFQRGDKLVGIAPLYSQPGRFPGRRILRFIGTGEAEEDQVVSEYLDVFSVPVHEQAVVAGMAAWLTENRHWHRVQFDDVLSDSLALRVCSALEGNAGKGQQYCLHKHVSGQRYFITLPGSMEQYLERLSASRRKRFARCTRALVKDGGVGAGQRLKNSTEMADYFPVLQQLNTERWRDKGGKGVFESLRFTQFHQKLCALLVPSGEAGITLVKQADSPIAALYLFFSASVCHYYQSGFRAEGANRYMPLFLGHMAEIQHCIDRKLGVYDFMRGAAESYKQDYGCESEPMFTARAWRNRGDRMLFLSIRRLRSQVVQQLRARGLLKKRA